MAIQKKQPEDMDFMNGNPMAISRPARTNEQMPVSPVKSGFKTLLKKKKLGSGNREK